MEFRIYVRKKAFHSNHELSNKMILENKNYLNRLSSSRTFWPASLNVSNLKDSELIIIAY